MDGKRRAPLIFPADLAYILIVPPMKQPPPQACGSPAPALTLGPKRTWRNGRRSRLQLECPRGNPRRRTAQIRGTLKANSPKGDAPMPIPSQARAASAREGVETRRGAPKAATPSKATTPRRRDSPDHERPFIGCPQGRPSLEGRTMRGGGESRSGKKICFSQGSAGSSPAVRTSGLCHGPNNGKLSKAVSARA